MQNFPEHFFSVSVQMIQTNPQSKHTQRGIMSLEIES